MSTKPDLVEYTLDARRSGERPVFVFDPQNIAPSLPRFRWQPINGADDTQTAMMRAKALVAGSRTPGSARQSSEGSAFYRGQAAKVLAALLHAAALDGAGLDHVLRWARKLTDPSPLGILTAHPGAGPGWADMLRTSTTGDSRTVGNTAVTLEAALEPLVHESVLDALRGRKGEAPTDFREILDAGGTVYLLGKDSEANSIAPLTTALTEDLLDIAETHAVASPAGRLDPPLLGALDEAPNIAPIPSLRQRVADGRGRGITVIYGLQGWASARARFGDDTADELASFTNRVIVFGGAKDPGFLKDMSELCGQVERVRTTRTTTTGDRGGESTATHTALEAVLRGDEIKALPEGHALLLADNLPPVITRLDGMWTWDTWDGDPRSRPGAEAGERGRAAEAGGGEGTPGGGTRQGVAVPAGHGRVSAFPPFPELPATVAEYAAARTTDINSLSTPAPWDLGALPGEVLEPVLDWIDAVCRWLNQTYAWQPHQVLPPCWQQHEHVAYEIAAFAFTRIDTTTDPGTAIIWHEQYDRFVHRLNNTLGKAGDDCRVGRHEPRPARFALSAWPPENRAGGPT